MHHGQIATVLEDVSYNSQGIPAGEHLIQINLVPSTKSQIFTVYRKQIEIVEQDFEPVSRGMVVRWVSAEAKYEEIDG